MRVSRVWRRLAVAVVMLAGGAELAEAASVCSQLEAQLSSLQKGTGARQAAAFAGAANQQRAEISAAQQRARQAGCGGGFLFFQSKQSPQCAGMLQGIQRMKNNLAKLESNQQNAAAASANAGGQRSGLLRQLGDNNCGPQYAAYSSQNRPKNFLERLFTPQTPQIAMAPAEQGVVLQRDDSQDSGGYDTGFGRGRYRTLCVRTCDGYYFPISYSTTRDGFTRDEQICKQTCPGTEVVLYAHRNPGQDSSKALSTIDESRYSDLPTAFAYRTNLTQGCGCGKPADLDIVAGGYSPALMDLSAAGGLAPIPDVRPSRGEDPETIANRVGQLDPGAVGKPNATTPVASLNLPTNGVVRRVGPSYFYAQ
ncbi:MAG: DUF2865 domain-containing protein [Rhizobiales bacterium]|nr:DUF2865 domain-containing protein [Hyphomicrobiales bacterium]